ncbi:MAG TPA: hypothetical protein VJ810_07945 [Blastocatellia bacterium]|nr:hypothetical protein [Blastocatellia bacterium]
MKRILAVALLTLLASPLVMGQAGKKDEAPKRIIIETINPMEDPERLVVSVLPSGGFRLNEGEFTDLEKLTGQLRDTLDKRKLDRRGVIIQAQPETRYGEVMKALDAIRGAGGMPIFPLVKTYEEMVKFELNYHSDPPVGPPVNLPPAVHASQDYEIHGKNAFIVSIPEPGVYLIGRTRITSADKNHERLLIAQIREGMKRSKDWNYTYVRCSQDSPYSDINVLMRAVNKAGYDSLALVVEKR